MTLKKGTSTGNGDTDLERQEGGERNKKGRRKKRSGNLPPLLSLSAGFTWIGLFICVTEREERGKGKNRTDRKKGEKDKRRH